MLNALTIDLEDWYQGLTSTSRRMDLWPAYENRLAGNMAWLMDSLSRAGVKATFFVLGYVADHMPEVVRRAADEGHEIALHSYSHQRVHRISPKQFRDDVIRGLDAVQKASGKEVMGYRAPMFSVNRSSTWVLSELCELGFQYDSSIFPIRNFYYGIPDASRFPYHPFQGNAFLEFPLSTIRLFKTTWPIAGGFYARLLPYRFIRAGIHSLNKQGQPAILYFHPWEFDVDQRFNQVSFRERITHYYNRAGLKKKFLQLLRDFKFGPISHLLNDSP